MSKDKRTLIIICLLVIQVGIPQAGAMAPGTRVRIEPADWVVGLNETFVARVVIEEAKDLGAFQFNLTYDPSIVQVTEAALGDFLESTGRSVVPIGPEVNNEEGRVSLGGISFGSGPGASGTGGLATLTCLAQGEGSTALDLQAVQMLNTAASVQPITVEDGQVIVRGAAGPTPSATATPVSPATATPVPAATATPKPTAVDTPTPAATAPLSPTPSVTSSPTQTPTKTPPSPPSPTPTPSVSIAPAETRPTEATASPTVPTAKATQAPATATIAPTSTPTTSPSPPPPTSTPSPTPLPSPTPPATLVTPATKDPPSQVLLVGLLAALGLASLAILILRRRPKGRRRQRDK